MKIDHILFPIDFSSHSRALNSEVEWLAAHFNSKVTLLHVLEIPTSWYGSGEATLMNSEILIEYMESERERLKDYVINIPEARIERVSAEGSPAWHIAKWTKDHDVDLIVMGTHGYGTFRRMILGSVAIEVLHDVHCPVWTHPAPAETKSARTPGISSIVCSIELSDETVPLLRFTRDVADEFGAAVRLVHTVGAEQSRPAKYFDCEFHRMVSDLAREEIARLQQEAGTDFPLSLTGGLIAQDLSEVAVDQHADLVVIGRGKLQGTLGSLRTHAYEIIRQVPCPVLSFMMADVRQDARHDETPRLKEQVAG
ncbi:MAG TPA: universal stress protein [Bryobacteraceae bacterium]|nr:universal stress protein [Bryobacteraceae bacterium]